MASKFPALSAAEFSTQEAAVKEHGYALTTKEHPILAAGLLQLRSGILLNQKIEAASLQS